MSDSIIGESIKQLRKQNELNQIEFAKKSGVSRSQVIRLESGVETNPSVNTLEKLANAVGYEVVITFEPIEESPQGVQ